MKPPYPTRTRLALYDTIAAGKVKGHNWTEGHVFFDESTGYRVTADTKELIRAGLVAWDVPAAGDYSLPHPTDAGRRWRNDATARTTP